MAGRILHQMTMTGYSLRVDFRKQEEAREFARFVMSDYDHPCLPTCMFKCVRVFVEADVLEEADDHVTALLEKFNKERE